MASTVDFLQNHTVKSLNIKFCKESYLNDTLICTAYKTNQDNYFVHKIEKDGVLICEIGSQWENGRNTDKIIDYETVSNQTILHRTVDYMLFHYGFRPDESSYTQGRTSIDRGFHPTKPGLS